MLELIFCIIFKIKINNETQFSKVINMLQSFYEHLLKLCFFAGNS